MVLLQSEIGQFRTMTTITLRTVFIRAGILYNLVVALATSCLHINEICYIFIFCVLRQCSYDVLLGYDFLTKKKGATNMCMPKFWFRCAMIGI